VLLLEVCCEREQRGDGSKKNKNTLSEVQTSPYRSRSQQMLSISPGGVLTPQTSDADKESRVKRRKGVWAGTRSSKEGHHLGPPTTKDLELRGGGILDQDVIHYDAWKRKHS
jgi:hypothetical protein